MSASESSCCRQLPVTQHSDQEIQGGIWTERNRGVEEEIELDREESLNAAAGVRAAFFIR